MVARVCQKKLKHEWRQCSGLTTLSSVRVAVALLNELHERGVEPQWLRLALREKYGASAPGPHDALDEHLAVERVCELSGIILLRPAGEDEFFTLSDIRVDAIVKDLPLGALARVDQLIAEVQSKSKGKDRVLSLLTQARDLLEREIASDPKNIPLNCRLALVELYTLKYVADEDELFLSTLQAFHGALKHVDEAANDGRHMRAKCLILQLERAVHQLDARVAAACWVEASEVATRLSHKEDWILVNDAQVTLRKVSRLRAKLSGSLCLAVISAVTVAADYGFLAPMLPYVDQGWLIRSVAALDLSNFMLPKMLYLALLWSQGNPQLEACLVEWFARHPQLELEALTHCAVDDEVLSRVLQCARSCESITLHHSIVTDSALAGVAQPALGELVIHGCNLVTTASLPSLWTGLPALRRLVMRDCALLVGASIWSALPAQLLELDLSDNPRITAPNAPLTLPRGLHFLSVARCAALVFGVHLVEALPADLIRLEADNLTADVADLLPSTLQHLHLKSALTGSEITLPELLSVRVGENMTTAGLRALSERSTKLQFLDLSNCTLLW